MRAFILGVTLCGVMGLWLARTGGVVAAPAEEKMLRHVVLFKFNETASKEQVQAVVTAFAALPKKIPTVVEFEYGTDNSPEGLSKGLTHAFVLTFKTEKDRDDYLPHPAHQEFVKLVKQSVADVCVVDYWVNRP